MADRRRNRLLLPVLLGAALTFGAVVFAWLLTVSSRPPAGPVPIVWDRQACAQCRMLVSDPAFASQLQLADGRVLDFDDPGCLFTWLAEHDDPLRAAWFRHRDERRWLSRAEVGFVSAAQSPMGYGLAAVGAEVPGAQGFDAVRTDFRDRRARADRSAP